MSEKTLAQKLLVKPDQSLLILNAPDHYINALGTLPEGATVVYTTDGTYDAVHVFAFKKADLDTLSAAAIAAVKPGGILWIMYPKKSGAIKTDITRDIGWETIHAADWHGVTQILLDDTWSALRFRPRSEIKVMTRKF
ncbi:MAG: hypothetical protein SF123_01115 [Chloroflexota bacterium]|nr:hypothetical protein [Chloroflexota bacterium]